MQYLYADELFTLSLGSFLVPDKLLERVKRAFRSAAKFIHAKGSYEPDMLKEKPLKELLYSTYDSLSDAVNIGLKKSDMPAAMRLHLQDNTFMFSGFKTHTQMQQASRLLLDDDKNIKPFNQFLKDVQTIDKTYNGSYLQAEYNFAVHSAQSAAQWQEFAHDADDFYLRYRTAGDERVREQHRLLDGITLPVEDKFWDEFFPPNGWNCRCSVIQVPKHSATPSSSSEAIAKGRSATYLPNSKGENKAKIFRFNPGKEQRIFPKKHPYFPKGCGDCKLKKYKSGKGKPECALCLYNESHFGEYINLDHKDWKHYRYDFKSNGYIAIHRLHNLVWKKTKNSVHHKLSSGEAELEVANYLCKKGYQIKLLKERNDKGENENRKNPDCDINGVICDIKYCNSDKIDTIRGHFRQAKKQGAKAIIFYSDTDSNLTKIHEAYIREKTDLEAFVLIEGKEMIKIER